MDEYAISPTRMGWRLFGVLDRLHRFHAPWRLADRSPRTAVAPLGLMCLGSAVFVVLTGSVGLVCRLGDGGVRGACRGRALADGSGQCAVAPGGGQTPCRCGVPLSVRSLANGLVTGAALLGVALIYTLFGQLIRQFDWPAAFVLRACRRP